MSDHIFICYARADQEFVLALAADLKAQGAPVWLDQCDIKGGEKWRRAIDQAIVTCAHFLIVLSPAAVDSDEVEAEMNTALDEKKPIVPVIYRTCRPPLPLRTRQYIDVSNRDARAPATLAQILRAVGRAPAPTTPPAPPAAVVSEPRDPSVPPRQEPSLLPIPDSRFPIFDWVTIPAGEFLMGSDEKKDKGAYDDELPQHKVNVAAFRMARVPVTNAQYRAFVAATGQAAPGHWANGNIPQGKEDHPVVCVSWDDAQAFCQWAGVRLPTEAEWEKAARGTDGRLYPWGNEAPDDQRCNFAMNIGDTTPVGRYPAGASPYGLLDMAGNVWEWTSSLWGKDSSKPDYGYPYKAGDGRENLQAPGDVRRVLRGGAFYNVARDVRCASRYGNYPIDLYVNRYVNIGFRVVSPGL